MWFVEVCSNAMRYYFHDLEYSHDEGDEKTAADGGQWPNQKPN